MIPTAIPDHLVVDGTTKQIVGPPPGDEANIDPVEALVSRDDTTGLAAVSVRLVLEGDELARLATGAPVWLTMLGGLAPFRVTVDD